MTALIAVGDWLSSKPMFHATQETVNMADNVSQILVACRAANVDFTAPGSMILCAEQTVIHTITHALWELLDVKIRRILLGFTLGSVVSTTNLGGQGSTPGNSWWYPPVLQILTLFQTKNVIFHTPFQA